MPLRNPFALIVSLVNKGNITLYTEEYMIAHIIVIIAILFIFFMKMPFNVTYLCSSKNKEPEIIKNNGTPIRDMLSKRLPKMNSLVYCL